MELPQPRPYGTEGRKATHDFLSLYSHSTVQQDPSPPSQGAYLRTHDFLQPLECMGRGTAKEESRTEVPAVEKPPPPTPPPSVGHILPGGIGTYTISHISCFNQRVPKPEGKIFTVAQASNTDRNDDNSNSSSYSGSGFALWQESSAKKGKTGKENTGERPIARDGVEKLGQWTPERPAQSSSNNQCNSFSSLSSSQPLGKKSQSFMDMIKSAKIITQDEEYMDDEEEFVLKKEASSTLKGELRVKVDGKSSDQKANTPRSKHSATEQRRRSKINDRFQMLRELIPNSDQKRDKASFLLEVIEYIQYLQEKVHKYDGSCQGWNPEPAKPMAWRNNERPAEAFIDQSRGLNAGSGPALAFAVKLDEKNITVSPNILGSAQNTVESDISTATTFTSIDHHPGLVNKAVPFPVSVHPNVFAPVRSGGAFPQFPPRAQSESENLASQAQHQSCRTRSCTTDAAAATDKMKEHDMSIEGGTISISSAYSQGLLNTLTQALQSSGVDLSQANISVQIELGKRAKALSSNVKGNEVLSRNQGITRSRVTPGDGSDQAFKKVKTSRS